MQVFEFIYLMTAIYFTVYAENLDLLTCSFELAVYLILTVATNRLKIPIIYLQAVEADFPLTFLPPR